MGILNEAPNTPKEEWIDHAVLQLCYETQKYLSQQGSLSCIELTNGDFSMTLTCAPHLKIQETKQNICSCLMAIKYEFEKRLTTLP